MITALLASTLSVWTAPLAYDYETGTHSGSGLNATTQQAFQEGLAALATLNPGAAADIQLGLDTGQFGVGELAAPNMADGAADGDTMLLNFKRNSTPSELGAVILHEWIHISTGNDGRLSDCAHAMAYYETWSTACDLNCEYPPGTSKAKLKAIADMYIYHGTICRNQGGSVPTTAPNCPCAF